MTDTPMTPDPGALEGTSPPPARTSTPAPQPAAKPSGSSQAELDRAGVPRWNAPADPSGERAAGAARERKRLGVPDPTAAPDKPDQQAAAKPGDGVADKSITVGSTTINEDELREFLSNKGAAQNGQTKVPLTPDGYVLDLPASYVPPAGIEISLDKADPSMAQLRGLAHKYQMPQEAVSDLLGLFVGHKAGELATGKLAYEAEVAKLGPAGPARIDALSTFLRGQIGDQALALMGVRDASGNVRGGTLWSGGVVAAYESIMNKMRGQGASTYTASHRDMGANDGKIPNYANMTFEQRRQAQDQRRGR